MAKLRRFLPPRKLAPIGGAAILGIAVGAAGTMGLARSMPGADAGDWLAFAGAMLAVILSIFAAVWIEDRKRGEAERADLRLLLDALATLKASLERQCRPLPEDELKRREEIVWGYEHVAEALETLTFVRQSVRPTDVLLWRRIREIERRVGGQDLGMNAVADTRDRLMRHMDHLHEDRDQLCRTARMVLPIVSITMEQIDNRL